MIAAYYRLSLADEDVNDSKRESNSITNQRLLIQDFIRSRPELAKEAVQEFVDDGYTGTNMNRPAFTQMMQFVKTGEVKTVVVKDFSRFARDYIEAGDYIERIFPFLDVRFIAIADGYDSAQKDQSQNLEVVIKNIVNTAYSRDLSGKITATKRSRQRQGLYLGGLRPFGFLPDPEDCHKLILDPEASKTVRLIFELAIEKKTTRQIATYLNEQGIPTRGEYKLHNSAIRADSKSWKTEGAQGRVWTMGAVSAILQNEKYKGTYVANRIVQVAPCSKRVVMNDHDKVTRIDDAHIGIITPEEFELAKGAMKKHPTVHGKRHPRQYPLRGKVVCGYCGRKMVHYNRPLRGEYYICKYSETVVNTACSREAISTEGLQEIVMEALPAQLMLLTAATDRINKELEHSLAVKSRLEIERGQLQEKLDRMASDKAAYYEEYALEKISKKTFLAKRSRMEKQIDMLAEKRDAVNEQLRQLITQKTPAQADLEELGHMAQGLKLEEISQEMAEQFLDRIVVYNTERVKIHWRFEDEIAKMND